VRPLLLTRAHGLFNLASGAWPLLHLTGFRRFFGPARTDSQQNWLVRTVAGLLVTTGWNQLVVRPTADCLAQARRSGLGTAATLLVADVISVPTGRARRAHSLDAVVEAGWLAAWWWAPVHGRRVARRPA
jgi:hypothetical protein